MKKTKIKLTKEEKKEARLQKKQIKKAKREMRRNRRLLFDPEKVNVYKGATLIGYLLRFLTVAFAAFAVVFMVADSFEMTSDVGGLSILLFACVATAIFALLFYGKWQTALIGAAILAVTVGYLSIRYGSIVTFFITGVGDVLTQIMRVIEARGFASLGEINLPYFGGASELLRGGLYFITLVLSFFFTVFSMKKVSIIPLIFFGSAVCAVCFVYNISDSNWGMAFIIVALASMVALSRYDSIFAKNKKSKKSRAYGGYTSFLAGFLALAIVCVPALGVKNSFKRINFIQDPMEDLRTLITAILLGGSIDDNLSSSPNFTPGPTSGKTMFTVRTYFKKTLYLRSAIYDDYDTDDERWEEIDGNKLSSLEKSYEKYDIDTLYTGDDITYELYKFYYGANIDEKNFPTNKAFVTKGSAFAAGFIDIEYINAAAKTFVIPSLYAPSIGVKNYDNHKLSYNGGISLESDGIYTSSWTDELFKRYSVPTVVPDYSVSNYASVSDENARHFVLLTSFVADKLEYRYSSLSTEEALALKETQEFRNILAQNGLSNFGLVHYLNYLSLTREEQEEWYDMYVNAMEVYTDHVNRAYKRKFRDSDGVKQIAEELRADFESAPTSHEKVMVVIDYLCENYSYSLNPKRTDPGFEGGVIDEFLLTMDEGYCVHFASAAVGILRELGMPTRYCQGYLASNYDSPVFSDGDEKYYIVNVTDADAHAWIEVYIEGLGWRTYETTPALYSSIYSGSASSPDGTQTPDINPTPPQQKPPVDNTPDDNIDDPIVPIVPPVTTVPIEDEIFDRVTVAKLISGTAALLLVVFIGYLLVSRSKNIRYEREAGLERARFSSFIDGYDRRMLSQAMTDMFYMTVGIGKEIPEKGESPFEFAERIDSERLENAEEKGSVGKRARLMAELPCTSSEVVSIISKREFGGNITDGEIALLSEYITELQKYQYESLSIFEKIWYRYIVCKL